MEVCIKIDQDTSPVPGGITEMFNLILNNQTLIMSAIDDLKQQVTDLQTQVSDFQTALDNEQAQVAAVLENNAQVVTNLNNTIADLNAQIANGATPEQLQELATGLTAIKESINTARVDLEGTITDPGA